MKLYLIGLFFLISHFAWAVELIVPIEELAKYFPNRKCHLAWHEGAFDPLRLDHMRDQVKETISDEEIGYLNTIKTSLKEKGIEGIVFGRGGFDSKILIAGHVFSPADEVQFVNDQGKWMPICEARSVILLSIEKEKGIFLVLGKNLDRERSKKEGIKFEIIWEDFFKF